MNLVAEIKPILRAIVNNEAKYLRQDDGSTLGCIKFFLLHHFHNLCRKPLHLSLEQRHQRNNSNEQLLQYSLLKYASSLLKLKDNLTLKGSLSVLNLIPGMKCNQRGNPLHQIVR